MKRLLCIIVVLLITGCSAAPKELGTLEGQVTIGPLQPVQREGEPQPTPGPEVYAARKIVVFAGDGKTVVAQVDIDNSGHYSITLPAGTYVIDINRAGIDRGIDLPTTVTILSGHATRLDVEIDTGIR
jgi:hypothetical protein